MFCRKSYNYMASLFACVLHNDAKLNLTGLKYAFKFATDESNCHGFLSNPILSRQFFFSSRTTIY